MAQAGRSEAVRRRKQAIVRSTTWNWSGLAGGGGEKLQWGDMRERRETRSADLASVGSGLSVLGNE